MSFRVVLFAALPLLVLTATSSTTAAVPAVQAGKRANIYVVAAKSFCVATGISDAYTGNGKVTVYLTLHNSGAVAGKVNIVPVRHYDDGGINESAMDMLIDVAVPAKSTKKFRSPGYSYKAHEHEVASCGLKVANRAEIGIRVLHL